MTGGAGFLGSHLAEQLIKDGVRVTVLDDLSGGLASNVPKRARFVQGRIEDPKAVAKAMRGCDVVFHLAADAREGLSFFRPMHIAGVNYLGSTTLLAQALRQNVDRFVFTSSMARYGTQPKLPFVETMVPEPQDPYGLSKYAFERLLEIYRGAFGLDYSVLVPHNIYGPRQFMADPYRNVIAIFMNRILWRKPPIVYGDGKQVRDFSYFSDCVPVIVKAATARAARNDTFNIGPDTDPITLNELAEIVLDVTGYKGHPLHAPARPGEVKFAWCSSAKARRRLRYRSSVPLREGVEEMWRWAKRVGRQRWRYLAELEIQNEHTPEVWTKKLI